MTEKRRILQPVNLIVFLIFALAAGVIACLPLFEGANVFLQLGWTCYLLLGMVFLFFVGEKIARVKFVEKYLAGPKVGRLFTGIILFLLCIGAGAAFRLWEISDGDGILSKNVLLWLAYYLIIGLFVSITAQQISGFKGTVAAAILITLCPFFDFSTELPVRECIYTLLVLTAIFSIFLVNYFVEKKSVSLQDTLLTILGAVSLAGAVFLHISAVILMFPCVFLLIRKSGAEIRGKREQRGLRSLLFELFFISSLVVIFLVYSVQQHTKIVDIPIDYNLLHVIGNIGREPMHALETLLDKFSGVFAIQDPSEYYSGLLTGMLVLGMIGAILLFKKKTERKFFPVYLFNWYLVFGLLLKKSGYNRLVLYVLLIYMTAGTMEHLSEIIFAGKRRKQDKPVVEEETEPQEASVGEEETESQEASVAEEKTELREETVGDEEKGFQEKAADDKETEKLEMEAASKEAEKKLPEVKAEAKETEEEAEPESKEEPEEAQQSEAEPEPEEKSEAEPEPEEKSEAEEEEPEKEPELEEKPETRIEPEEAAEVKTDSVVVLEKQMEALIKREDRILEIMKMQSTQISKLEEELREQRIRTKKMERHYRKELAITRNKKR